MDLSALQQVYYSIPSDQKGKFVLEAVKWLLGLGWKKLSAGDKKKTAPEAKLILRASMADIERFDPDHQRLFSAVKKAAPKKAAAKKKAAPVFKRAPGGKRKNYAAKKASGAKKKL